MNKLQRIIPLYEVKQVPDSDINVSEDSKFSHYTYTHGYGQISKAGCVLTKGVSGTIKISLEIATYDSEAYEQTTDEIKQYVQTNIHEHLVESERKRNYSDWFFWLTSGSESDYNHQKEHQSDTVSINNQNIVHTMNQKFSENKKTMRVSGEFTVQGSSSIPTEVYLYVETLNITTADGQVTTVINSTPTVADKDGNTNVGNVTDGKLNIVPLGG